MTKRVSGRALQAALCVCATLSSAAMGFSSTKEFEFPVNSNNRGDFQSPVTTYNGCIYAVDCA